MKKTLLAVATLGAFTGVAHAQSSVTLYGIIDEALVYQTNQRITVPTATTPGVGKSRYYLDGGSGLNASRWGLKGAEDLGGGLKAVFQLENGFTPTTGAFGQGGLEFGRQAYVGLSSKSYGTVTLGRQYDDVVDFIGPMIFSDQIGAPYSALPADLNNANNSQRVNNAIKYTSPNFNGLSFGGMYSLGGVAGSTGRNEVYSVGVNYANGPLGMGAAFLKAFEPNTSFWSNSALSSGSLAAGGSSITGSNTVFGGYATANSYQVAAAGATYAVGPANFGVIYSNTQFQHLQSGLSGLTTSAAGPQGTAIFNAVEVNFTWHFTPALQMGGAYSYTKGSMVRNTAGAVFGGAKYNQFTLSSDYALSKRTDVYLTGTFQTASGTDSTGAAASADISTTTPSANNHEAVVRLGLRHKF